MRVCNLFGCGLPLLKKNGSPDYRKHWCSRDHKNLDKKEAMQARRKHVHWRKCRLCGRRSSAVSQDTAPNTVDMNQTEELAGAEFRLRSERPEEEVEVPQ